MKRKWMTLFLTVAVAGYTIVGCGTAKQDTQQSEEVQGQKINVDTESQEATESAMLTQNPQLVDADEEGGLIRIGAMSGPTAMGMVHLMSEADQGQTKYDYEFGELVTEATALSTPLVKGELDIAAVPSNLAANLYQKTEGGIEILAVNNLGVLSVVERGEDIQSLADLAGKTVYATGQGAVPEYTFRYLLTENGIDPDTDLTIQWCSDTTEALSYVNEDENAIAVLPQPFVTVACTQVEDLRIALDLNDEWDRLDIGCNIVTGVIVVRTEFAEEHPQAVADFLEEYEKSMEYISDYPKEAADLIAQYGIVPKSTIAEKALPGCHLNYMDGEEMKTAVEGFLQVLYEQNPQFIGGSMPGDDFYYGI